MVILTTYNWFGLRSCWKLTYEPTGDHVGGDAVA